MSRLLSERVKKVPATEVSAERYDFLKLSEAEPDLGVPSTNGYVLSSTTTGQRTWVAATAAIVAPGVEGQVIYNNNGAIDGASSLVYDDVNGRVGIGTATPNTKLDVAGDIEINQNVRVNSQLHSIGSVSPLVIGSFSVSVYGGGKIVVQVFNTQTNERQYSELLIAHDNGTNAIATEYGVIYTGAAPLASFQVDINSGNLRLLATGANTNLMQYRVFETLFLA